MPNLEVKKLLKLIYSVSLYATFISCNGGLKQPATNSQPPPSYGPPAIADDTSIVQSGDQIFKAHCIACHGAGGDQGTMGALNLKLSRIDSLSIAQTIKNGRGKMPPFNDLFSDSEMINLVAYVKGLRDGNK